jgi:hypothetical protein
MSGVGTALLGSAGQAPFRPTPTPPPHDAPGMSGTTSTPKGGQRELEPLHVADSTLATRLGHQRDQQSNTQRERFLTHQDCQW